MSKVSVNTLDDTETEVEVEVDVDEENVANRRRANRAGITVRIDYATIDEIFSEFTRDISEGGVFVETDQPHPLGTTVSMQFHLSEGREVLRTLGRVVRVRPGSDARPPGMGIEFDKLSSDDRLKIDQIVRGLRADSPS